MHALPTPSALPNALLALGAAYAVWLLASELAAWLALPNRALPNRAAALPRVEFRS